MNYAGFIIKGHYYSFILVYFFKINCNSPFVPLVYKIKYIIY